MRPGLRVRVAFCDLNTPRLVDVLTPDAVVTPFLLADAYHAQIDIPHQIASCDPPVRQAAVLGEDDRLVDVLHERLAELGVNKIDPELGVLVVAIGSTHATANARTAQVADKLIAGTQWFGTTTAFATAGRASAGGRDGAGSLRCGDSPARRRLAGITPADGCDYIDGTLTEGYGSHHDDIPTTSAGRGHR